MGFPLRRFVRTTLPPDTLCPACRHVLDSPMQCQECKVVTCGGCRVCEHRSYAPADLSLLEKLRQLVLKCDFTGCDACVKMSHLDLHESQCPFRFGAEDLVLCPNCEQPSVSLESHSCIDTLLALSEQQDLAYAAMEQDLDEVRRELVTSTEKAQLIRLDKENRLSELRHALQSTKEEVNTLQQEQRLELKEFKADSGKAMEEFRKVCPRKVQSFLRNSEQRLDARQAQVYSELQEFMLKARTLLAEFQSEVKRDFMQLHVS
mmetsp:Transcript_34717/g.61074  ORF Transcript_34717/g.61074 Transcript_34717/m.61074 type:complete len:262 (-) Transcript_34717:1506-2291(-)